MTFSQAVDEPLWIFAYGSLIWRPDFAFEERLVGRVDGYARRFWQASTDHRGTPESPGRVVTMVPSPKERCWGVCFRVRDADRGGVLEELAIREKGGYSVERLRVVSRDSNRTVTALGYVGHPHNPNYVGEAPLSEIADIVRDARGPSGHNVSYVLHLAEALSELDLFDEHVFELANQLIDPDGAHQDD